MVAAVKPHSATTVPSRSFLRRRNATTPASVSPPMRKDATATGIASSTVNRYSPRSGDHGCQTLPITARPTIGAKNAASTMAPKSAVVSFSADPGGRFCRRSASAAPSEPNVRTTSGWLWHA